MVINQEITAPKLPNSKQLLNWPPSTSSLSTSTDSTPASNDDFELLVRNLLRSIVSIIDQYATFWDTIIISIGDLFVDTISFIDTMPSLSEAVCSLLYHLPGFVFSCLWAVVYSFFYIITLPGRIFIHILWDNPLIVSLFFAVIVFFVITVIAFIRRISMIAACRRVWNLLTPYLWTICYSLLIYLFPPLGAAVTAIKVALSPVTALFNFIIPLFYQLGPLRHLSRQKANNRARYNSRQGCTHHFHSETPDYLLCCICFTEERSVMLQPCNHFCVCSQCANKLLAELQPLCPLCRSPVVSRAQVYLS